uniref:Uncharacterized protein n=1 Tax=Pyricularia oryzae (strain P131) TaxID=1143193 RepID=L7JAM4_PYRO1
MQIWYVPAIVLPSQDDVVLTCKLADKATLRGTYRYSDGPERQRPAHLVVGSFKSSNQDTRSADVLPGPLHFASYLTGDLVPPGRRLSKSATFLNARKKAHWQLGVQSNLHVQRTRLTFTSVAVATSPLKFWLVAVLLFEIGHLCQLMTPKHIKTNPY